jgi:3-oxoacyl-[acyl-carrier protein] reductase
VDLGLRKKKAILVGASYGIGLAAAHELAREGCDVAICSRSQANIDVAIEALASHGTKVFGGSVDVRTGTAHVEWIESAAAQLGGCDIFISFASANTMVDDEVGWRAAFETDALPLVRGVHTVLPYLRKSDAGSIVTISSTAAVEDFISPGGYHAVKAAVMNYSSALSQTLAPEGIRVNCITPGPILIAKRGWDQLKNQMPAVFDATVKRIPMGRMGSGEEIGRAIAFCASPVCRYMTGANIVIDGGFTKRVQF